MTIQDLKNSINESNFSKENLEDLPLTDLIEISISYDIKNKIIDTCKVNGFYGLKGMETSYTLRDKEEEVLNLLRSLYTITKKSFVRSVIVTVGKSKKFTDKQMDIITDELVKFNNLEINI